jgi:hypothetical protein
LKTASTLLVLAMAIGSFGPGACQAEKAHSSRVFVPKELSPGVKRLGYIEDPRITESSGVVASRQHPGVFWTHNDGAKSYLLFAMTREGKSLGSFHLAGAVLNDWEDIAIDNEGHLFVGDIGNNDARRFSIAVHEIDEPDPKASGTSVRVKRSWHLRFPKAPFDCETLFVWAGFGYVVSKVFNDERAEIYRFPLTPQSEPETLEFVARLKIDSPVTGGDITNDGKLLGLVAKSGAYVYSINGNIPKAAKLKPAHTRFKHEHVEGCCFVPDGLLATAETREIFLFTDPAFHPAK